MAEEVFADTAALVALANEDEYLHRPAVSAVEILRAERVRFVTTDDVLVEVGNLCSARGHRLLALDVIGAVQRDVSEGRAILIHVDEQLWARGWELFKARPDKEWGLTDCISFVVMQERGMTRAFTSDQHFEQAGYVRLLRP